MGRVTIATSSEGLGTALPKDGLAVVMFSGPRCPLCVQIMPEFERQADKYPSIACFKADCDDCPEAAALFKVSKLPTFFFFRDATPVSQLVGADPGQLAKNMADLASGASAAAAAAASGPRVINDLINKQSVCCLNENTHHTVNNVFSTSEHYLESDCDEQLLITVEFNSTVQVTGIKIIGRDPAHAPQNVKIFANPTVPLDFDSADSTAEAQSLALTEADVTAGHLQPLKPTKFKSINSLTLFVRDNQGGEDTTAIRTIEFYGEPLETTKMGDFKRVAGHKGEAH